MFIDSLSSIRYHVDNILIISIRLIFSSGSLAFNPDPLKSKLFNLVLLFLSVLTSKNLNLHLKTNILANFDLKTKPFPNSDLI